ncbi:ABC transporter [Candidatus Roizmanbacteria bacterium CG03_land_8_20_14_0_80_36_21]|nr:MAG: ABC transporter [Candidatus Roizmanbacteria bacterium CG03_land_8_20_14_0_80_36_21]
MISVKNLTKIYKIHQRQANFFRDIFFRKYKQTVALDQVSFEIGENELVGFIGPNGAGKTTTVKILSGILYPTSGQVGVLGFTPFEKNAGFLKQIAFVMGSRNQLIWELPASDSFEFNKTVYELSDSDYKKTVGELADILNCQKLISRPVKTLSLGERMKMELIAALLHQPRLIFFDEPTIGLDIFSQEAIREFIKKFQQKYGSTIILTSHYLEDVKRLAKRLIVINQGKILYDGLLKKIIDQYSRVKFITLTLEKKISNEVVGQIGLPLVNLYPKVVWKIDRKLLPEKLAFINENIPYSDLSVEEERIEEIIKTLFKKKIGR